MSAQTTDIITVRCQNETVRWHSNDTFLQFCLIENNIINASGFSYKDVSLLRSLMLEPPKRYIALGEAGIVGQKSFTLFADPMHVYTLLQIAGCCGFSEDNIETLLEYTQFEWWIVDISASGHILYWLLQNKYTHILERYLVHIGMPLDTINKKSWRKAKNSMRNRFRRTSFQKRNFQIPCKCTRCFNYSRRTVEWNREAENIICWKYTPVWRDYTYLDSRYFITHNKGFSGEDRDKDVIPGKQKRFDLFV